MNKKIDFSAAIASLKSLNSNTNSITQTISKVQVIVENTSNNISKLENYNGSLAEDHSEKYQSQLVGTVNHKNIFDVWAIWKINGCNNIQSTINNLTNKISNLDNSINELKLKSINADAALAIMEKYNLGIDAILATGITLPKDLLAKIYAASDLSTKIAWDEYAADRGEWVGVSDKNIQWWIDKPLKFVKDPNGLGTNAWLVMQQDENGNWVGMGWTDEATALQYSQVFGSEIAGEVTKTVAGASAGAAIAIGLGNLPGVLGGILGSGGDTPSDPEESTYSKDDFLIQRAKDQHGGIVSVSEVKTDENGNRYRTTTYKDGTEINDWFDKDERNNGKYKTVHYSDEDEENRDYTQYYTPSEENQGMTTRTKKEDGSFEYTYDPNKNDKGLIHYEQNADGSYTVEFDPNKNGDGRTHEEGKADGSYTTEYDPNKRDDGRTHEEGKADGSYTIEFDPNKRDDGRTHVEGKADGSYTIEFDSNKRDDGMVRKTGNEGDKGYINYFEGRDDGKYKTEHLADGGYIQYFDIGNGEIRVKEYNTSGDLVNTTTEPAKK